LYVESQRANLGLIRIGEHVIADLASHDFAILDYLMPEKPTSISASGAAHFRRVQEDIAFITLHYPAGVIAHISVNWLSPIKLRQIRIGGDRKLVTYDDLAIDGKIRVYNSGADVAYDQTDTLPPRITYRQGEVHIIATDSIETLPTACSHFIECIVRKKSPDSDGASGKRIVELVTAATDSMRNHGQRVTLPTSGLPE
jgi:predicted dehydrogenase